MFNSKLFKQSDEWIYNQLSWLLLEFKLAYYYPTIIHASWKTSHIVPDSVYDAVEDLLKSIAVRLNKPEHNIVGFNMESPSGKLVVSKLSKEQTKENCPMAIMNFIEYKPDSIRIEANEHLFTKLQPYGEYVAGIMQNDANMPKAALKQWQEQAKKALPEELYFEVATYIKQQATKEKV